MLSWLARVWPSVRCCIPGHRECVACRQQWKLSAQLLLEAEWPTWAHTASGKHTACKHLTLYIPGCPAIEQVACLQPALSPGLQVAGQLR